MSKFKIGDRVLCIRQYQGGVFPDERGVVECYDSMGRLGVIWDGYNVRRHGLGIIERKGHGWYVPEDYVILDCPDDFGEFNTGELVNIDMLFC